MFTGIVEAIGRVAEVTSMATGCRLRVETPLGADLKPGDSVAVNGVCLTAVLTSDGDFQADIGPETARVTTLGALRDGQGVNLERPLRVEDRLGGHFVLGHVDGVGVVNAVRVEAESHWLTIGYPPALAPLFISKGSVAVDGISLTVAGLGDAQFDVQVIPFTWEHTTLRSLRIGDPVNLECDMVGKYIVRRMELSSTMRSSS
jgi:riboflavin synthase